MRKIDLTEEQKDKILTYCKNRNGQVDVTEITQYIFGPEYDGRSIQGRAIKVFLVNENIGYSTKTTYQAKGDLELSKEQKQYIDQHYQTNNPFEIAQDLFSGRSITPLSQECRTVRNYILTLPGEAYKDISNDDDELGSWNPPRGLAQAVNRVNKFVYNALPEVSKLKNKEKRWMEKLSAYLHTYSFVTQINLYKSKGDRELFESSFIENTYNKPDLTNEEVTQYIYLAREEVNAANLSRRIEIYQKELDRILEETQLINPDLSASIEKLTKEYHNCCIRKNKLLENLVQKRSAKIEKQRQNVATIADLVKAWKEPELRREILSLGKQEIKEDEEELEKLKDMDELKAKILGLSEKEAIFG